MMAIDSRGASTGSPMPRTAFSQDSHSLTGIASSRGTLEALPTALLLRRRAASNSRLTSPPLGGPVGLPNFLPKHQVTQQYEFTDTLAWTTGRHQLKFGVDLRSPLRNLFQDVPATRGALNFDRIFTCQRLANNQCAANTGLSYADFLIGYVQTAQLSNPFQVDQRLHMYSAFVQDDFKVTP